MHLLLTDLLTCPRCGPDAGLILRADSMSDRRVREGALGCPACRTDYPITAAVARFGDAGPPVDHEAFDDEAATRIAALMGAGGPTGFLLIVGPAARAAATVASLTRESEIVAASANASDLALGDGVSGITIGEKLPFCSARVRGVWLSGTAADNLLEEGARVTHALGRLILEPAPEHAAERLTAAGLRIAAREDRTVLAIRPAGAQIASPGRPSLS
ncbi:MAG: hypothetical protein L0271_21215 [Gemmatimonadetes bacterium]|nr:hypothetical protein [Gemmatimonadota bacterium]